MKKNITAFFSVMTVIFLLLVVTTPAINNITIKQLEKNKKIYVNKVDKNFIGKIREWIKSSPLTLFFKKFILREKLQKIVEQSSSDFDNLVQNVLRKERQENRYEGMKYKEYYEGAPRLDNVSYYAADRLVIGFKSYVDVKEFEGKNIEGFPVIDTIPILHVVIIKISGIDPNDFIKEIEKRSDVNYAELDGICYPAWEPNDEYWEKQWGHKAIKCPEAWNTQRKEIMANIIICDSGIDESHEDLDLHYCSGIDYVNGDNNPNDDTGHGTACTGIIMARTDNVKGIAGVPAGADKWGYLTSVKVLGNTAQNYNSLLAKGIVYALTTEMTYYNTIISISIESYENFAPTLRLACEIATANGCLIFAAAGNNGNNRVAIPASFETTICVGAVEWKDDYNNNGEPDPNEISHLDISAYGNEVDIVAPGKNIYTTLNGNQYGYAVDGTSSATAYAAGVAALYFSKYDGGKNAAMCKAKLFSTAIDLGEKGKDQYYGYGLINACDIIKESKEMNSLSIS